MCRLLRRDYQPLRLVSEGATCGLRIGLRHVKVANDLENQIASLRRRVAVIQHAGELRVQLEPPVRITVGFASFRPKLLEPFGFLIPLQGYGRGKQLQWRRR